MPLEQNHWFLLWGKVDADEVIPSKHYADKFIELENGYYSFCIRQMFDSSNYDIDNPPNPFYEIIKCFPGIMPVNCLKYCLSGASLF